jgi:hypothetical protein
VTGARRARPPFTLLSRANVIWGLASYILTGLGVIAEIIASAHALPLRVGISLVLAGAISLGVRGIALITTALLTRRSGRRLVETLLNANCTFWPFRLGGSPRAFRARSLSGPALAIRLAGSELGLRVNGAPSGCKLPARPCSRSTGAAQRVCGRPPRTAVARMRCCTSLLYGPIDASKSTVKGCLTVILRL